MTVSGLVEYRNVAVLSTAMSQHPTWDCRRPRWVCAFVDSIEIGFGGRGGVEPAAEEPLRQVTGVWSIGKEKNPLPTS